jgi:large repetitive protein
MNKILIFLALLFYSVNAQTGIQYILYGPGADPGEGDDNHIQVINIQLPDGYAGHAYIRLFDISCGSSIDELRGSWNSSFRFSIYKNEYEEESFTKVHAFRAQINKFLISKFDIGYDSKYFGKWDNFVDIGKYSAEVSSFSLVAEGVEGDDGNTFELFVSSDSLENKPIAGLRIYSYEPTIRIHERPEKLSFPVMPNKTDYEITVHIFDFDGTKGYFSTKLRDESPLSEIPDHWSSAKFQLDDHETGSICSLDIGPETKKANDITFRFTGKDGKKFPIDLPYFIKDPKAVPSIIKEISYPDCNTITLDASGSTAGRGGALTYSWKFNDGLVVPQASVKRSFEKPGSYHADIYIEEKSETVTHAAIERVPILINVKPIANAGGDRIGIPNRGVEFNADKSYDTDGKILKYTWLFGDGSTGNGVRAVHAYTAPGKYTVILKTEDDYFNPSCNYGLDTVTVVINSQPVLVTKEKISGAINQIIKFDAASSYDKDGTIVKYIWDFGDQGVVEGAIIEHSFTRPGKYKVALTVQDNSEASNNSSSATVNVFINDPPQAAAGKDRVIAENEESEFDGSGSKDTDGRIIDYEWNFGDGAIAGGKTVRHRYSKAGTYKAILKVRDDSGTSNDTGTDSVTVIVNDRPKAKIENEIYLNESLAKFDASKSYHSDGILKEYKWNFGDGSAGEGKVVSHNYKLPGTYRIILKVTDERGASNSTSFDTSKIIINKRPIADAGPDRLIAPNTKVRFSSANSVDPDGAIKTSKWFIDNQFAGEGNSFEYCFTKPGTYLIGLEVTDDFKYPLTGIAYAQVKVNSAPRAVIDAPRRAGPGQKIKFDASKSKDIDGTIKEYSWKFSDGIVKSGITVERSFDNPGIYSAVLKVKDDAEVENSVVYDTLFVSVNHSPEIKIKEQIETCGSVVTFDASRSADPDGDDLTFSWEFPSQPSFEAGAVVSYDFKERGILPVILSADDGRGFSNSVSKKTILVKIHQPPVADAGIDTTVCAGEIVIFNGLKSKVFEQGSLKYEWLFDDSTKMTGSNVYKVFNKGGIYKVLLKVTDNSGLPCNTSYASKLIKVIEAPVANAGADFQACANSPVKFDGSKSTAPGGIISSYLWDFGDGESGSGVSPVHIYTKPGQYKVSLTITGNIKGNCDNNAQNEIKITINNAPSATFAVKDSVAENEEVRFDASGSLASSGSITDYLWDFGDGTVSHGVNANHAFLKYGNYNVVLKIQTDSGNECNSAISTKSIYVNGAPVAKAYAKKGAGVNEAILFDGSKSFDINGKISSYSWDFGDGESGSGINIYHIYRRGGKYRVILTVRDDTNTGNSSARDTLEIAINASPVAKFSIPEKIFVSNKLTLDGTGSYDPDGTIISYEWYINDVKVSGQPVFTTKFDEQGLKRIRLVVKDNSDQLNGMNEMSGYLRVEGYPIFSIPDTLRFCAGESFLVEPLIISGTADAQVLYQWRLKNGEPVSRSKVLQQTLTEEGNYRYYFEMKDYNGLLLSKDSTVIVIGTPPVLSALRDTTVLIGGANDEVKFDAARMISGKTGLYRIRWDFGDGHSSNLPIVFHRYVKEGVYRVELEVDDQKECRCSISRTGFRITVMGIR